MRATMGTIPALPTTDPSVFDNLRFMTARTRRRLTASIKSFGKRAALAFLVAYVRWKILRTRRDPNAPCPACGARDGKVKWIASLKWPDGKVGALVHRCNVCEAKWGERPIFAATDWKIDLTETERSFIDQITGGTRGS